jgi:hypothetical protein
MMDTGELNVIMNVQVESLIHAMEMVHVIRVLGHVTAIQDLE